MGDSIDNIPGVPGVGEKTAVKLISQFGSVERLYDNLTLVTGKAREILAANRKQALLSRELATVSTRVPIEQDLEAFRRQEPDWERLRALWTELEFHTLLRQLPAAASAPVTGEPMPVQKQTGDKVIGHTAATLHTGTQIAIRSAIHASPWAPPRRSAGGWRPFP